MTIALPSAPTAEDYRSLARSSPWRFATLHWTNRGALPGERESATEIAEAWLRRPGHLTVRDERGVHVAEGAPYGTSVTLEWPDPMAGTPDPTAAPGLAPPDPNPPPPPPTAAPQPVLRPDGLVARRPDGYHYDHGDPMWRTYLWTAMLDPEELSHSVDLTDVHARDRLGRTTWWATAKARPGYDPRCGCCPLLLGLISMELEHGPFDGPEAGDRGWDVPWQDLPTAYLVGLDVRTGVVVDLSPLDGTGGSRFTNDIHAVDEPLDPPRH